MDDPTGVTDEEREEDEMPNFAGLCPMKKSTPILVVSSEGISWLG